MNFSCFLFFKFLNQLSAEFVFCHWLSLVFLRITSIFASRTFLLTLPSSGLVGFSVLTWGFSWKLFLWSFNFMKHSCGDVLNNLSSMSSLWAIFLWSLVTLSRASLSRAGYTYNLEYEEPSWDTTTTTQSRKNRKRKIIWFNPPLSKTVKTNVGSKFLQLVAKHFPKENPLHKIFNKNSVKTSYRCTPNLGRKISAHNRKILEAEKGEG